MPTIELTIDGQGVGVTAGATLLDAAERLGVDIPRLCHVPGLPPRSVCRLCLVRVDGRPGLTPACSTPATAGVAVTTADDEIKLVRRTVVAFALAEHGQCGRADCEVEALADSLGVTHPDLASTPPAVELNGPLGSDLIQVNPALCVHCDRCIRSCERGVITRVGRGRAVTMGFGAGGPLTETDCVGCGDCVAVCPAGVLSRSEMGGVWMAIQKSASRLIQAIGGFARPAAGGQRVEQGDRVEQTSRVEQAQPAAPVRRPPTRRGVMLQAAGGVARPLGERDTESPQAAAPAPTTAPASAREPARQPDVRIVVAANGMARPRART